MKHISKLQKNPSKPFHVKVNEMDVEALGTQFNINSYTDEPDVRTTLIEGSVRVRQWSMVNGQLKTENEALLKPGEQSCTIRKPLTTHH